MMHELHIIDVDQLVNAPDGREVTNKVRLCFIWIRDMQCSRSLIRALEPAVHVAVADRQVSPLVDIDEEFTEQGSAAPKAIAGAESWGVAGIGSAVIDEVCPARAIAPAPITTTRTLLMLPAPPS
jgi:hypothetical protein